MLISAKELKKSGWQLVWCLYWPLKVGWEILSWGHFPIGRPAQTTHESRRPPWHLPKFQVTSSSLPTICHRVCVCASGGASACRHSLVNVWETLYYLTLFSREKINKTTNFWGVAAFIFFVAVCKCQLLVGETLTSPKVKQHLGECAVTWTHHTSLHFSACAELTTLITMVTIISEKTWALL